MKKRFPNIFIFTTIFIGILSIGGNILFKSLKVIQTSKEAEKWPTTIGIINSHEGLVPEGQATKYTIRIRYSYMVSGKEYTGDRIAFGFDGSNKRTFNVIMFKLKDAKKILVRYKPDCPHYATLAYGSNDAVLFERNFGIAWIIFVLLLSVPYYLPQLIIKIRKMIYPAKLETVTTITAFGILVVAMLLSNYKIEKELVESIIFLSE